MVYEDLVMTFPFLYQLQNASFNSLKAGDFKVAVVDPDDSDMSANEVNTLQEDQGKMLYAYRSIGEAEDYRDYWKEGNWSKNEPDFLLEENPKWPGNYLVKFWDEDWQDVVFDMIDDVVAKGYNGVYLDIVDGYNVAQVKNAYPGSNKELRQEMIDFVIKISEYAKAQNPDFQIIPQNAVGLLSKVDENPGSGANKAYIDAIDGLGIEDLWYDDNKVASWSDGDLKLIKLAQDAGKFVLATSYPTQNSKKDTFIDNAIEEGLIPYVGDRELDSGNGDPINNTIEDRMEGVEFIAPWDIPPINDPDPIDLPGETNTITGTNGKDELWGGAGDDVMNGKGKADVMAGGNGNDEMYGGNGADELFGNAGDDTLDGGRGNDYMEGGSGADNLLGGRGRDTLLGGNGDDYLEGGSGHDILSGGRGDDELSGGKGDDTFVFEANSGYDVIEDFNLADDVLNFTGGNNYDAYEDNGTLVIDFAGAGAVELTGLTLDDLSNVTITFDDVL
ncbi:MJ1477/TM1410 family putative glycoside hydrolase [Loktanella agnita]|uniref:MJ1477/TM1410 family putative glycoside hydrolase n=1 Tax=Loktanella agnita TaxID=287097 RepID=UPI003985C4AA